MSYIDFSQKQHIQESLKGEAVIEPISVRGVQLESKAAYLYITRTNVYGTTESVPVSPSQARALGELLIAFANQQK